MMTNKRGFTLVEMLIVIGIMSILVIILSQVFGSILTTKLRSEATTAVAQDGRYLLTRLAYDIGRASDITSPTGSTLVLTIGGLDYVYTLSNSTLVLSIGGGPAEALSSLNSRLSSLSFTRTDLGVLKSVQVNFVISPSIPLPGGANLARELTTTVALRE